MTGGAAVDLVEIAERVEVPGPHAGDFARLNYGSEGGGLVELAVWLAETRESFPVTPLERVRCLLVGGDAAPAPESVSTLAERVGAEVIRLDAGRDVSAALQAGYDAADREAESGTDLLIVAGATTSVAPTALIGVLCDVEPVALLPRGAAAVDTAHWIGRAALLRDGRRALVERRGDAQGLLDSLADPVLAAATALILQASARRTPLVLDGSTAVAAALLCHDLDPRMSRWWQVADSSDDPAVSRACTRLGRSPVLALRTATADGTAGLLTVPVLHAAAGLPTLAEDDR